jgi:hypothetical protein
MAKHYLKLTYEMVDPEKLPTDLSFQNMNPLYNEFLNINNSVQDKGGKFEVIYILDDMLSTLHAAPVGKPDVKLIQKP